ncbi:hypothetical protein Tco_0817125 [Tanacetum coccineum]
MTRISRTIMVAGKPFNTEHKLNEYKHIKPVKQKKHGLGHDSNEAACKEVDDLTQAGILGEVKDQTWVANPVMVKKSDGGLEDVRRVHGHKQSLSQRLLPLPKIDWKVESLLVFRLKYFLDVYKGYHQIKLAKEDEGKTAFFAGEGVFCYQKLPFGLKNAGATYQRLVDKSTSEEGMLKDIQEAFDRF